jgi:hypothetical protein
MPSELQGRPAERTVAGASRVVDGRGGPKTPAALGLHEPHDPHEISRAVNG